ncbi:hypothetical protein [Shimia sp. R11_0]|nr:hypothetical protein [Shimia sp. R11_0]
MNIQPIKTDVYLTWFYEHVAKKLPFSRYDELLPWKFKKKEDDE